MMNLKKQLWSLARLALLLVGFTLTSAGVYMVSLETLYGYPLMVVLAYGMMVLGFVCMLTGVFWSICHSMKSKVYQRGVHQRQAHIFTVNRPSSFPPSYEQSQSRQYFPPPPQPTSQSEVVLDVDRLQSGPAPPLYSQDSSEAPDGRWSWEPPPRYSQVEKPRDPSPAP